MKPLSGVTSEIENKINKNIAFSQCYQTTHQNNNTTFYSRWPYSALKTVTVGSPVTDKKDLASDPQNDSGQSCL